jgi:hypothetical protein
MTSWIRETLEQSGSKTLTEDDVLLAALKVGLYAAPTAFHDGTAENDSLEFGEYADALVNIILKPQTVPPLVVGIYGPWGSGKSTFMRLVRDRLIERTAPPAQSRLKPYVVSRFVRAKRLFRRTDAAPKLDPTSRLIPINYDAWAYADATKLWTGLIERIARELDAELGWWGRFKYLCDSNLRKLLAAFLLGLLPVCWLALRLLTAKLGTIDARDQLEPVMNFEARLQQNA